MENLGGADPLPGGGDLDQHALTTHPDLLIETDQVTGLVKGCFGIEGKTGVNLRADASRNDLQDLTTEKNQCVVDDLFEKIGPCKTRSLVICNRLVEERAILGIKHGLEDQGRIRRGILGLKLTDILKVAGIGDDCGELLERLELVHACFWFGLIISGG